MTTSDAITPGGQHALLDDAVSTLIGVEKTIHQLEATRAALLAVAFRIAEDDAEDLTDLTSREMAHRAVATEIGAALHVSDRTIESQMSDAVRLVEQFPATAAAFGQGLISKAHVRMILDIGTPIETAEGRAVFESHVLERAKEESANRVRPFAKQVAERVRGVSFQQRQQEAKKKHGVWVTDEEDGDSTLHVRGASAIIHGVFNRMTQMGHAIKTDNDRAAKAAARTSGTRAETTDSGANPGTTGSGANPGTTGSDADTGTAGNGAGAGADAGMTGSAAPAAESDSPEGLELDDRTLGQLRADIACDLLLTGIPTGHNDVQGLLATIRANVEISIPITTITDPLDTAAPAYLAGVGPIDPDTARILAADAPGWDRIMTDPLTGAVVATDRYRPTEAMRRYLRARDQRCRFMGCGIIASKTDDDHTIDFALGGTTDLDNLSGKCRRHHMTKHHTPWTLRQLPGGVLEWTSPTGRVYTDRPPGTPGHVTFEDIAERVQSRNLWAREHDEATPF